MVKNYHPQEIEKKWQKQWQKSSLCQAKDFSKKKKYYALVEFPYPSGEGLHIGHAFTNTILDVLARKKRMEGRNVLHPMGWDAFGLPTENYAVKAKVHPAKVTKRNTDQFCSQMKRLALSYDWGREVNTTDPKYYKWTQWIFLQMFKHGLAYKQSTPVGWCSSCKIILANEEIVSGKCERCGHEAEYRQQKQWLLAITKYASRLADELDLVDYPGYIKASQRNWIGRKEWIDIDYQIEGTKEKISVSTTRPDTNFGATFVVLAPEHPLVDKILKKKNFQGEDESKFSFSEVKKRIGKLRAYVDQAKKRSELERISELRKKTGVFTGLYAINQLNGYRMPIWVTDFVLASVGTGAVVGVPGHDIRDFEFAQEFNLEVIRVVVGSDGDKSPITRRKQVQEKDGTMINSGFLNGMDIHKATQKMMDYMEAKGWGKRKIRYHLRDWIFSRQHYWGEPFPMIYCESCAKKGITWWDTQEGKAFVQANPNLPYLPEADTKQKLVGWMPLPEKELPLELPKVEKYQPTDTGESPLAKVTNWVKVACPECGKPAKRETDTMPNWAGSSWYFLRYCDPDNDSQLADPKKMAYWMPVDLYLGGAEHTTLHLLYSRFWHKFLNDIGRVPGKEPYQARRQHGVILGEDGQRMSKSRGNVINPEAVMDKFGVDTLRVYLMFMGPYDSTMPWSTKGVEGAYRFLSRIWRLYQQEWSEKAAFPKAKGSSLKLRQKLHQTIKKVTEDIEELKHNTAIAALMEFINDWSLESGLSKNDAGAFLLLLAPFAPYLAEEIWVEVLENKFSIHQQKWPKYDSKLVKEERVTVIVQVNGKVRGQIEVESGKCEVKSEVEKLAKTEKNVARYLKGKKIKKAIFVPGKLVNFVV